jgi:hypothetical protein
MNLGIAMFIGVLLLTVLVGAGPRPTGSGTSRRRVRRRNIASGAPNPASEASDDCECTLGNASLVGQSSMPGRISGQ